MEKNNNNNENTLDMIKFEVPYFQSPNGIFDLNLDLKPNAKLVYLYLCRCGNQGASAFPSYNKIAEACSIGRRTAIDCVQNLVDVNLLHKEGRKNEKGEATSNLYIVNMPENSTCARLKKDEIKAKKKTRNKSGATDALPKNDKVGGATDALGGATDAPYKELLDKELYKNNYTSSSSKGENSFTPIPLIDLFTDSICELKKTTTVKFMKYVKKYDREFIEAVISYCEGKNCRSFDYFDKAIKGFIEQGATTPELMEKAIDNFRSKNKTKKNNAIKAKEEVKKEKYFDNYINDRALDEMLPEETIEEKVELNGQDVNYIKESIKDEITEVSFNTWISSLDLRLNNGFVVVYCPNSFTKDIVNKRYKDNLIKAMEKNNLGNNLDIVIQDC